MGKDHQWIFKPRVKRFLRHRIFTWSESYRVLINCKGEDSFMITERLAETLED